MEGVKEYRYDCSPLNYHTERYCCIGINIKSLKIKILFSFDYFLLALAFCSGYFSDIPYRGCKIRKNIQITKKGMIVFF